MAIGMAMSRRNPRMTPRAPHVRRGAEGAFTSECASLDKSSSGVLGCVRAMRRRQEMLTSAPYIVRPSERASACDATFSHDVLYNAMRFIDRTARAQAITACRA